MDFVVVVLVLEMCSIRKGWESKKQKAKRQCEYFAGGAGCQSGGGRGRVLGPNTLVLVVVCILRTRLLDHLVNSRSRMRHVRLLCTRSACSTQGCLVRLRETSRAYRKVLRCEDGGQDGTLQFPTCVELLQAIHRLLSVHQRCHSLTILQVQKKQHLTIMKTYTYTYIYYYRV